jgi:fucose permease
MSTLSSYDSHGKAVFIVTTTTFVLASVFVLARLLSRFAVLRSRTLDDWFMILAWLIAFGLSFAIDYGTSKGLGRHDSDIPPEWLPALRRSEYAFTILYNPALMATKTSILIFYLRLSRNTQTALRIASHITLAVVNVAGIVLTFLNAFQCDPVSAAYDPTQAKAKCLSIVTLYLCSAPVNIITDLAILVLPIPVLTGVRLPQRQKSILVFTFALGIFVTIVDVVRIYYLQQASTDQFHAESRLGTGTDFAWAASTAFMWSAVEVNVGIICACIPTLKPLIKRILPSMITEHSRSNTSTEKEASSPTQIPRELINARPHRLGSSATVETQIPPRSSVAASNMGQEMMDFLTIPRGMGFEQGTHHHNREQEMDVMDFLTSPGMAPAINQTRTRTTHTTDNTVYLGFVNMRRPKSMLKTRGMESFKYCTLVTILFFLWGFSYGLLNNLNNEISTIAHQSTSQNLGLGAAYFGAYFFGALTVGQAVLRHSGFKATFISGLCIYGTGTLMFWPSAVLTSYPGFIISNFVVGFGLSVLETAANPFLALCGRADRAEFRLLMAQAVQAVASVLSQLLAEKVLFTSLGNNPSLIDVQWAYLSIALFSVFLALFFYYMPLPEATDTDLQQQAEDLGIYRLQTVFSSKLPLVYVSLSLAVLAQFVYVAAQESMSNWFAGLLESVRAVGGLTLTIDNYIVVGHSTFAVGRFLFAGLTLIIPPRILLFIIFVGCLIFSILTMSISANANEIAGPALVYFFFEGPVFPMVFAMGLRGLGRQTKWGAGLLTAAASGGGMFPFVMWAVQRLDHKSIEYSYSVIVALFSFGLLYPIYLNFVPKARSQVDPMRLNSQGLPMNERERQGSDLVGPHAHADQSSIRRLSQRFSNMFETIKTPTSVKGRGSQGLGFVEHREQGSVAGSSRDVI